MNLLLPCQNLALGITNGFGPAATTPALIHQSLRLGFLSKKLFFDPAGKLVTDDGGELFFGGKFHTLNRAEHFQ